MSEHTKEILDKIVGRLVSRKLLVWGTATALAIVGSVTSEDWVAVSLVYIGSQAAVDLATVWRHGK
jgi:hypothetical protein|tara:strand:- start:3089 stop:3286 length:198 start_codon:yes stop_codon:yes gene_type:complete